MRTAKCGSCGHETLLPEAGQTGDGFGCMKCGRPIFVPPKVEPAAPTSPMVPGWAMTLAAFLFTSLVGFVAVKFLAG